MKNRYWQWAIGTYLSTVAGLSMAQIALDGSLGQSGALTGPDYQIDASLGQQQGSNLFHSFQTFTVQQGESASFNGPDSVSNIIGRVTGGTASNIDGQLKTTIPNADLYLVNPAGIMFGENASLDVQGGFHASTAEQVIFSDGSQFNTDLGQTSTLSTAPVSAFGFLSDRTADIRLQGSQLATTPEQTVSLIGGNISMTDGAVIRTAAGRFNIAATQGAGTVTMTTNDVQTSTQGGDLTLSNSRLEGDDFVEDTSRQYGTAAFYIRAGNFVMSDGSFVGSGNVIPNTSGQAIDVKVNQLNMSGGSRILNVSEGSGGQAGDIVVNATEAVTLQDVVYINNSRQYTRLSSSTFSREGNGGNIYVTTPSLTLTDGARIEASMVSGVGNGGQIVIQAPDIVIQGTDVDGNQTKIGADNFSFRGGSAGGVTLQADTIQVLDGGLISSFATAVGNGGTILIYADKALTVDGSAAASLFSSISTTAELLGDSGNINIFAGELTVSNGGQITTATGGYGQGGSINIVVDGAVELTGEVADGSGNISNINALSQYSTTFLTYFSPNEGTAGSAGNITLQAKQLLLSGGAQINSTSETNARAGDITINIAGPILLTGQNSANSTRDFFSGVNSDSGTSTSAGEGVAGNISIQATQLDLRDGALISTEANTADGGNIQIQTTGYIYAENSSISASVGDSVGSGGNLTVTPSFLVLSDSPVIARAVSGPGGNISIITNGVFRFLPLSASPIDASSQNNVDGVVAIDAPDVDLSGSLLILASDFLSAEDSLQTPCTARLAENLSSLVVAEREGVSTVGSDDLIPSGLLIPVKVEQALAVSAAAVPAGGTLMLAMADANISCKP